MQNGLVALHAAFRLALLDSLPARVEGAEAIRRLTAARDRLASPLALFGDAEEGRGRTDLDAVDLGDLRERCFLAAALQGSFEEAIAGYARARPAPALANAALPREEALAS